MTPRYTNFLSVNTAGLRDDGMCECHGMIPTKTNKPTGASVELGFL